MQIVLWVTLYASTILHIYSNNLFFVFIGLASLVLIFSCVCYNETRKLGYMMPTFVLNGVLLFHSIQLHNQFGAIVSDYFIASAILVVYVLMSLVALIPAPLPKGGGSTFLEIKNKKRQSFSCNSFKKLLYEGDFNYDTH